MKTAEEATALVAASGGKNVKLTLLQATLSLSNLVESTHRIAVLIHGHGTGIRSSIATDRIIG